MKEVFVKMKVSSEEILPQYQTKGAVGADLLAFIEKEVCIEPGCSVLIPTGVYLEVPEGYEVQVRSRSGLAARYQISVLNSPGTIDCDYRGEVKVILINHGKTAFSVLPKMRIAQMVVAPVVKACFKTVEELQESSRGDGGFGSTGL